MKPQHWHLYTDGAARNNPGPAGVGIAILHEGKVITKQGCSIGKRTNNQAEYLALIFGLFHAAKHLKEGDQLSVFADSELLVRQMKGEYRVKNEELQQLQQVAFKLLMPYDYGMYHIYREENELADELANHGIDKKIQPPVGFLTILKEHGISL